MAIPIVMRAGRRTRRISREERDGFKGKKLFKNFAVIAAFARFNSCCNRGTKAEERIFDGNNSGRNVSHEQVELKPAPMQAKLKRP
jgi:hypothetical protein